MAIVVGQIEPLKKLKEALKVNGITRFNSIGEINEFTKNYANERKEIPKAIKNYLEEEIINLETNVVERQQAYDDLKAIIQNELHLKVKQLEETSNQAIEKSNKNFFNKILYYFKIRKLLHKKSKLENNLDKITKRKTYKAAHDVVKTQKKINNYMENKEKIISARCKEVYKELDFTKKVVDELYPLIAGAIGENLVLNEIKKLPDNYYLINDYSTEFNPPIYKRKEDNRIFSIQIDHLLISQAGLFLLETKNWSKQSIQNLDLRSPVEQILRTSYALFVLLNSEKKFSQISLERHHWGSKKIPIRNIIVMTNEKPKEEFKHVKILSHNELNNYIQYFDPFFNEAEVKNIFDYLRNNTF